MTRRLNWAIVCLLPAACFIAAAAPATGAGIIGTQRGKVYHTYPVDCGSAKHIRDENKIVFESVAEAEAAGRRLCKRCGDLARRAEARGDAPKPRGHGDRGPRRGADLGGRQPRDPAAPRPPDVGAPSSGELPEMVRVSKVLAGGTLVLDNGEKAVLLGVVWPARGQSMAKGAVRLIKEQTRGRRISVRHDASPFGVRRRDGLGRLVVYATPEPDGRDLAGELIFQGYGWLDRDARFARRDEYVRQEDAAWRAKRGIWKGLDGDAGESAVVTGRHADHYHRSKCPDVKHLTGVMELTINEAKERRLTPCSVYRRTSPSKQTGAKNRGE